MKTKLRSAIFSSGFITLLLISACTPEPTEKKPNIVLILTDDQGWGDVTINGNEIIRTPNIDRIAANGITLEQFIVSPVCSPTRAEILTGRYHVRGGVSGTSAGAERLDLDEETLADILKEHGYHNAAFGKWHNGMQYPYHPLGRGFEEFYGFCSGHWGNYFNPMLEHNGKIVEGEGYLPDDLTNHALSYMEKHADDPFFIFLPFNTPHSPMQVPDKYWEQYKNRELPAHRYMENEEKDHTRAAYATCENIDLNVGRILDKINALGLDNNTILIFMSDNGPNGWRWNGGMKGKKGSTDEGGVRSPFFIQWKGKLQSGKKINELAGAIDLLPTLTDLAGINHPPKKSLDGMSLKNLLLHHEPLPHRYIASYWNGNISIRSQRFRLDASNRLFDIKNDPGQYHNLNHENEAAYDSLLNFRKKWEEEVLTELPIEDTRPYPVGHPDFHIWQLPARDGIPHGNIQRSNQYPNCTFFTNWKSEDDSITWDIDVWETGNYNAVVYYTCEPENTGVTISLSFGQQTVSAPVLRPHNPPLQGAEHDRVERKESYVKDFNPLEMGIINLTKGRGNLTLKAKNLQGSEVADIRMLMLYAQDEK